MPDQENIVRCMIVDDEPMARDILRNYIDQVPALQLVAEYGNGIDASFGLNKNPVDLIFLDIKMPQLTGTDFVRSLPHPPKIIFTTAHKEYAHEGFELDIVDYLLKPIRFDRFLRAVNKAFPQDKQEQLPVAAIKSEQEDPFIYLRIDRKMVRVLLDEILYVESNKDYVKIVTDHSTLVTRQTISSVEAMLSEKRFIRIHRSYIVSLKKIRSYSSETVDIGNYELPVGKLYRNHFLKKQEKVNHS